MTATAMTTTDRPTLALKKKRVVNVAAIKQQNLTPKQLAEAAEKQERRERHELKMKEQAEAAERKRAKHAEFLAQQERQKSAEKAEARARNRVANEEAQKRATEHRRAFNEVFSRLTMIGCNKPLAINSYAILLEYAHAKMGKDVAGMTVRRALQQHCDVGKYLNMLAASAGKPRYHPLSGVIMGVVTEEEAAWAKSVMDERRAKRKAPKVDSDLTQAVQAGTVSKIALSAQRS